MGSSWRPLRWVRHGAAQLTRLPFQLDDDLYLLGMGLLRLFELILKLGNVLPLGLDSALCLAHLGFSDAELRGELAKLPLQGLLGPSGRQQLSALASNLGRSSLHASFPCTQLTHALQDSIRSSTALSSSCA